MADASNRTGRGCLSQLPAELLYEVFQRCPDFTTVWSLLNASSRTLAVFNTWAPEIVNAVLNSTVPVQTRVHMRQVLALRTGTYSYASYAQARRSRWRRSQLSQKVIATPAQLRTFVKLSHRIHILAHLCIERCLQRCLNSPLGQREYPIGFRDPTWTEEQRTILSFWRVVFFNELKLEGLRGHLDWTPRELEQLQNHGPYQQFAGLTPRFQASTALRYIYEEMNPEGSEEEFSSDTGRPFQLPMLPKNIEFAWTCEPPPSLWAVNQGWDTPDQPPESTATPKPQTRRIPERIVASDTDSHNQELYSNQSNEQSGSEESETDETDIDEYESDDLDSENGLPLGCFIPMGSSSEESLVIEYNPPSDPDIIPPVPFPIQPFGDIPPREEWRMLHGKTIGVHFWYHMRDNRKAGPGQYIRSAAYLKYGFAIWEEQRMVEMGLWSSKALTDASEYLLRWYSFLSEEDLTWYDSRRRRQMYSF
ncbi:hypothetical protein ETB97_011374 [Aspergillus alliaceus]|uniref:F-box domain-containing protein n=1 Tax=Petromyces alliaceus TaxID=209559 RepID=A0A8H5ZQ38_PETAA|nr:hypothetical protein ETB97_011374 [Aspergillus burnettii]